VRWRSVLGWVVLALLLVVGLPLHVCMPVWTDVHLFDLAARVLLRGGILYREICTSGHLG
jgi:hypothetical protein